LKVRQLNEGLHGGLSHRHRLDFNCLKDFGHYEISFVLNGEVLVGEKDRLEQSLDRHGGEGEVIPLILVNRRGQCMNDLSSMARLQVFWLQLLANETQSLQRGVFDLSILIVCIIAQVFEEFKPLSLWDLDRGDRRHETRNLCTDDLGRTNKLGQNRFFHTLFELVFEAVPEFGVLGVTRSIGN
jgi:hypothetical protein